MKLKEAVRTYRPSVKEAVGAVSGQIALGVYFSARHWVKHEQSMHAGLHHDFELIKSMGYGASTAAAIVAASRILAALNRSTENIDSAGSD